MSVKLSRRALVPPFIAMDVLREANELAAGGADVIHLEVGQPSTPAPRAVVAAAEAALRREVLGYTDALGLPVLREAIARHYQRTYRVVIDPARIIVTTGSSAGFVLAFLAAFDAGERVALAAPSYPAYRNILVALDLAPVELAAGPAEHYQPTLDLLRGSRDQIGRERLDGLIIASPANPTGSMIDPATLVAIAKHCEAAGIRLISDEIYHGITYEKPAASAAALSDDAIIVNSFSKYYSMTGWRIGWMIVPPDMLRAVECLAQNLFISPPALAQYAALAAFDATEELEANCRRYAENRALLLAELPKAGFERFAPADGAFYLYADIAALTNDSRDFCSRMLREIGVACTPGVDFDPTRGHATMRICFAGATADIAEAVRRLHNWKR
ncbi:MAG TPA: aminotransferase class I/II-fold pyridoxal phosphate-dependent enzyme [Stellaceae bacterium]|nr:aminotransferase class I/II-fold pyridoxal phosphate-dependent enzyme [Stellaceae bacterium]